MEPTKRKKRRKRVFGKDIKQYTVQMQLWLTPEQKKLLIKCSGLFEVSQQELCREAIMDRIRMAMDSGKFPSYTPPPLAKVVTARKPGHPKRGAILLGTLKESPDQKEAYDFLVGYIKVCKKHPRLESWLDRTIENEYWFESSIVTELLKQMKQPFWNSLKVLDALDTMPYYNGDDLTAKWGQWGRAGAHLGWLMKLMEKKKQYGWYSMLGYYVSLREEAKSETPVATPAIETRECKPIADWISRGQNFIDGSSDAIAVLEFVSAKCNLHGIAKVKEIALKTAIGDNGWANFKKAF